MISDVTITEWTGDAAVIHADSTIVSQDISTGLDVFFNLAGEKIQCLAQTWDPAQGSPVFTVEGRYTSRGWTDWTQGFMFGNALYQYDASGDRSFLDLGRSMTLQHMSPHLSHTGVHDHGFNNVSTYGNLLRLMAEGGMEENPWERRYYELALKVSGAVQASRWTEIEDGLGYIYSFNGPHSLFSDTLRSLRVLALGHLLGHSLRTEQDREVDLMTRLLQHAETTARYNVYFGRDLDIWDVRGRVVHESIFNTHNGSYRSPSTQQGYSPFSTWTRGLAWILCGYAELGELFFDLSDEFVAKSVIPQLPDRQSVLCRFIDCASAAADFYIENTPADGIPYWDTGAPGLSAMPGYLDRAADPFNPHEPVDSSAAAIAGQGLFRLSRLLTLSGDSEAGRRYEKAGLTLARSLFREPYLSRDKEHQGLLLHAVYHRPQGWDHRPDASGVPRGESCMWGDYHLMELAVYLKRLIEGGPYLTFYPPSLTAPSG